MKKTTERQFAFSFGVIFVVVLILLAVCFPSPTPFQYTVFRVVLSLAAAGVGAMIPGFLEVNVPSWIKAGGALAVFMIVFFYNPAASVADSTEQESAGDFEVHSQQRTLDLRKWRFVPDGHAEEKLSPAIWKDIFKVRRMRSTANAFTIRHATTGVPNPGFSSATHRLTSRETTEKPQGGPRPKLRIFDVSVDVSTEPVGRWFEVEVDATYWNACNDPEKSWAAHPISHPTALAIFEVMFPQSKPVKSWERREGSRDTTTSELLTDSSVEILEDNRLLRWRIEAPQRNWVYKFLWEW